MTTVSSSQSPAAAPARRAYVPAVGPRLGRLLAVVFALFALLVMNSVYLLTITIAGERYQNYFYQWMFLLHLVLGLAIVLPVVIFGAIHMANARHRPNRRAKRVGYALFTTALVLLLSGLVLTRLDGVPAVNHELARAAAYWLHVACPVGAVWLFILHRLAGRAIRWRIGVSWAAVAAVFAGGCLLLHRQDPRAWNTAGPESGEQYFFPSLARTATGGFIDARVLQNDAYCRECHPDAHRGWMHSAHRLSSFNNPPYNFSVRETRRVLFERDGTVQGARFCAGCHDPVPFFSGAFDDPRFDEPEFDLATDVLARAGITCTVCHSISHVNSPRGNADYTIDEPIHYPFAFSESPFLRWVNRTLIKAKPEFHKAVFLKPLHRTTEFCGTCHKVHLPPELNDYKFLRGQNHQDSFWLSGVSGQGVASFYYPPQAQTNCNGCHMPLRPSADIAARPFATDPGAPLYGQRTIHDHQFPSANTGIVHLLAGELPDPEAALAAHRAFLDGVMRVDVFGVREEGTIAGELHAPLRPDVPELVPGRSYLLEVVIRTVKMGHHFTQGTADSNEVWMDVTAREGNRVIGRSGGMSAPRREVDPWSHYVNAFVIDREGRRINRRNAQDIFIALYDNQIPPGAADVVHYRIDVPEDAAGPITVDVALRFRKFDTEYLALVYDDPGYVNDLPIVTLGRDRVVFPVAGGSALPPDAPSRVAIDEWERWNDYGIALLRKGQLGELRQAEDAFGRVRDLGRAEGALNLARVYIKEGRVAGDAPRALAEAGAMDPPAHPWSLLWFGAQVSKMNGDVEDAIAKLEDVVRGGFAVAVARGFDFSKDWRVLNELGNASYELALSEMGTERLEQMRRAVEWFERTLVYDPENLTAHWGLKQAWADLGDAEKSAYHAERHAFYKPDDNARDLAVTAARRRYPAANHAAEAIVIYDLHRRGAYDAADAGAGLTAAAGDGAP